MDREPTWDDLLGWFRTGGAASPDIGRADRTCFAAMGLDDDNVTVIIREATPDDLDLVCRMRLAFLAEHRGLDSSDLGVGFAEETRSFLDRQQRAGTLRSWLAESDRCVGVVSLLLFETAPVPGMRQTPDGYIINMYVEPTDRGRGTGRALLDACREAARELRLRSLTLRATDAGRPLYLSAGFSTNDDWMELPLSLPL